MTTIITPIIAAGLMCILLMVGGILMIFLDTAGLTPMFVRDTGAVFWPSWLPIVGDTFLWIGLLRFWLIGLVVVPIATYFVDRPDA